MAKTPSRRKRQRVVITPEQYREALGEAIAMYQNAVESVTQVAGGVKSLTAFLTNVKSVADEEEFNKAASLLKEISDNNQSIITALTELKTTVEEVPKYYPYDTERLDMWGMQISSILVGDVGEKLQFNLAGLADITNAVNTWSESLPKGEDK